MQRFKLLWVFTYLYEWIKTRGRSEPFGVIIDEFAALTQKVYQGENPLAQELDTFINVYMRANSIWFSCAHQELYQIDEQLRNTLLSLGTYILGGTSSMESARVLADALFLRDPYWVKHYRRVWGSLPHVGLGSAYHVVIDLEPEFMRLEEQRELFAQRIKNLGRFQFLLRPAVAEGHIGQAVLPLTLRNDDRDKETGEYQYPDPALLARVRAALASHSGMPIGTLLKEQEARLLPAPSGRRTSAAGGGGAGQRQPQQKKADFKIRLPSPAGAKTPGTVPAPATANAAPAQPSHPIKRRIWLS
jgi:hypothetical protein